MVEMLSRLIKRMDSPAVEATDVIPWSCPVPAFGDLSTSFVATLGLNPSNREFVDEAGNELKGASRRLHTLKSLGLTRWSDADAGHVELVEEGCRRYFSRNPYNDWFRSLDLLIAGTRASYYGMFAGACHLDLIPYATRRKWTDLTTRRARRCLPWRGTRSVRCCAIPDPPHHRQRQDSDRESAGGLEHRIRTGGDGRVDPTETGRIGRRRLCIPGGGAAAGRRRSRPEHLSARIQPQPPEQLRHYLGGEGRDPGLEYPHCQ